MARANQYEESKNDVGKERQIGDLYIQSAAHTRLPVAIDQDEEQADDNRSEGNELLVIEVDHSNDIPISRVSESEFAL